jgi:hypothetical protein
MSRFGKMDVQVIPELLFRISNVNLGEVMCLWRCAGEVHVSVCGRDDGSGCVM